MSSPAFTDFPNANKPVTATKCNAIYWQVLMLLESSHHSPSPTTILRELWQVQRCNSVASDLSDLQNDVIEYMGKDGIHRVVSSPGDITDADREAALSTVIHYREYMRRRLFWSLLPQSQAYHVTFHQWERMVAFIGLGGGASLGKWVWKQEQMRRKR